MPRAVSLILCVAALAPLAHAGSPTEPEWTDGTGPTDLDLTRLPYVAVPAPEVDVTRAWLERAPGRTSLLIQVVDLDARTTPDESLSYGLAFRGNGCAHGGVIEANYLAPLDRWLAGYACYHDSGSTSVAGDLTLDAATDTLRIELPADVFTLPAQGRISTLVCTTTPSGCATLPPATLGDSTDWAEIRT